MTDPIRRVIGNLFGHPLVEQVRAERIEEAIAFEVTFIANAHGVDPVWYAQWLGPLVDTGLSDVARLRDQQRTSGPARSAGCP